MRQELVALGDGVSAGELGLYVVGSAIVCAAVANALVMGLRRFAAFRASRAAARSTPPARPRREPVKEITGGRHRRREADPPRAERGAQALPKRAQGG